MVLDEGASTSVLSLTCWKALGSPELVTSPTTLKDFDEWGFQPHGIISALAVELGGVAAFHTPGSHGRNLQAIRCILGGKSRVKAVTLCLTPPFRLNS